jgi:hypothetical protein
MMRVWKICIFFFVWAAIFPASSFAVLLGPYSGKVVDSRTGEPVSGASVLFYWTKMTPNVAGGSSDLIKAKLVYTDAHGKYKISPEAVGLGLLGFLESSHVLIYQPGYQLYNLTIWADDTSDKSEQSFQKMGNTVKLERVPPYFDHQSHYDRIEDLLWGIDEVYLESDHFYTRLTWDKHVKLNLRGVLEKEEFLRRVEWEGRRR